MIPKKKYKHTIAKQVGGDDGYCWAVINKKTGRPVVSGLTRREVAYYRERVEKDLESKIKPGGM
jgi:hypothetical protein